MRDTINKLFDWKKNPSSVFYLVIPLVALAVGLLFTQAYLQYKINNDVGYFVILGFFVVLSAIVAVPMRRMWRTHIKLSKS